MSEECQKSLKDVFERVGSWIFFLETGSVWKRWEREKTRVRSASDFLRCQEKKKHFRAEKKYFLKIYSFTNF